MSAAIDRRAFMGKVALVPAASGIGRVSAPVFAAAGATVVSDIAVEGGDEIVRLIHEAGGDATYVRADVSWRSATFLHHPPKTPLGAAQRALDRRLADQPTVGRGVAAWVSERNAAIERID